MEGSYSSRYSKRSCHQVNKDSSSSCNLSQPERIVYGEVYRRPEVCCAEARPCVTRLIGSSFRTDCRPGEKFKTTVKKRKGGGVSIEDVNAAATAASIPDEPPAEAAADPGMPVGAAACVRGKLRLFNSGEADASNPLVLRTPREASHLVR